MSGKVASNATRNKSFPESKVTDDLAILEMNRRCHCHSPASRSIERRVDEAAARPPLCAAVFYGLLRGRLCGGEGRRDSAGWNVQYVIHVGWRAWEHGLFDLGLLLSSTLGRMTMCSRLDDGDGGKGAFGKGKGGLGMAA